MLDQQPQSHTTSPKAPPQWFNHPMHPNDSGLFLSEAVFNRTLMLLPVMGYTLLLFALIDSLVLFIPLHPSDPIWILDTLAQSVERSWVTLFGLVLVFYGRLGYADRWELQLWSALSRMALLLGTCYLLALPLGVQNAGRVYQLQQQQFNGDRSAQTERFAEINAYIDRSTSIADFGPVALQAFPEMALPMAETEAELAVKWQAELAKAKASSRARLDERQQRDRMALFKQSAKSNLGTLIAGIAFLWIWRKTRWARHLRHRHF
ncbi:HpsJ-like protein, cyanoexosortase A-associated [Roseofilum casamattae]|uniref:HpsJ family protein n=1 Tax=Roseofilum casamattae BLCC-M143 TaxID=3022442 RepID=A0ABT7BTV4_9CYAN|nr:HpsJ family protein [Roseofilum casamattae]MDJ1181954.1 HpsJ family protein [Roseofilum casamattae BLCC-M143]